MRTVLAGGLAMLALSAMTATALAAEKPVVKTSPATEITTVSAWLNGTVNPKGLETTYWFEYGTTESYGSTTTEVSAGKGTTTLEETARIKGLIANTKYDFRIVAKNSDGTVDGSNLSFTTKAPEFRPNGKEKFTGAGKEFQLSGFVGTITCKNETADGEVTGQYTVGGVVMTLTGCTAPGNEGQVCEVFTVGRNPGEIVTNALKGQLGVVPAKEAKTGVGLLLNPETGTTWTHLGESQKENKVCTDETGVSGNLAFGVGTVGEKRLTDTLTAALYEGLNIREVKLASGETVKPELMEFGARASLTGVDEVTFAEGTEIT